MATQPAPDARETRALVLVPRRPERPEQPAERPRERYVVPLPERAAMWREQLSDELATVYSDVDFDLRRRVQQVLVAVEETVGQLDPAKDWPALAGWLRERLAFEMRENHLLAAGSVRAISLRSAERLRLGTTQIIDPPVPAPPTDLAVSLAEAPKGAEAARTGSVMNVVLRGYLGFVMYFMLSHFVGLDLPLALGLLPAALMAGLAVREERTRKLATRRTEAEQALRGYVAEFGMWVGKGSQDRLRRMEQDLRAGYEARIDAALTRRAQA